MLEMFFAALTAATLSSAVAVFLGKAWIETRLKESIKHEYDQKIALFKRDVEEAQSQKQKIELVSELVAEWMATPPGEVFTKENRRNLNRLSFQATLWLPAELAIEVSKRLQLRPDAKTAWELILFARRLLTGDTSLETRHVTFWGADFEKANEAGIGPEPKGSELTGASPTEKVSAKRAD